MPTATDSFCRSWAVDVAHHYVSQIDGNTAPEPTRLHLRRGAKRQRTYRFQNLLNPNSRIHPASSSEIHQQEAVLREPLPKRRRGPRKLQSERNSSGRLLVLEQRAIQDQLTEVQHSSQKKAIFHNHSTLMSRPRGRSTTGRAMQSTSGQRRKRCSATPERTSSPKGHNGADDDPTPRAVQPSGTIDFRFSRIAHRTKEPSEYSSRTGSTRSQSSSKKSRSQSPKKSTLQAGIDQFTFEDFSSIDFSTFPLSLQRMISAIECFCNGVGVLPSESQVY